MKIPAALLENSAAMAAVRRDLHAHPELAFDEFRTADVVAGLLSDWGIPVHRGLGGTGVVGILKNGAGPRAIGLRADMDALPVQETNGFRHASVHAGRMHACGHDGHTAMLLAAAQHLAATRRFDGTVYLIFQPAEESDRGARAMIRDGLFERFPMEAVFGMHNWPGSPVGRFAVSPGPVMASINDFRILVRGRGCHAAHPHNGIDPVPIACELVLALQTVISRSKKPIDAALLSVTMIHAGEASNVVPDSCELRGTARTFSMEVLDLVEQRMRTVAEHVCAAHGAACEFEWVRHCPPTVNSAREAAFARQVMVSIVGEGQVDAQEPTMGGEDFAFMLQARPGAYCFIGNGDGGHRAAGHGDGPCVLHNPGYDFNDDLIPLGAAYWTKLAETWLAPTSSPSGTARESSAR